MKCSKLFEVYKRVNAIFILLEVRGFAMDFVQDNSEIAIGIDQDLLVIHNVEDNDTRKEIIKVLKKNKLEPVESGNSVIVSLNFYMS